EAWWSSEAVAAPTDKARATARARAREEVVLRAASTWLNRLVLLRMLEAAKLSPPVLSGGWQSRGYKDFVEVAPALRNDPTQGYAVLLGVVFGELARDLPGLFGACGLTALVPMPPATLRHLVEALDEPALASCWSDDLTLGWVYQYWNDPARE